MKKTILACAIAATTIAAPAYAKDYRATNWLQPIHTLNSEPYQKFAENIKASSNGDITFTIYSGGTLVPAKTTLQALRDDTAQLGIVFPGYTPAELPLNNVLVDLGFLVKDSMAAAFAYTEINLANKALNDEWRNQGALFAGGYSTPIYNFMCTKPIQSLADAKGKKMRTAGGTQTNWVSSIGGVPVSVPIGDVYTGLSRGSLDCTLAEIPNLINSKLIEVIKSMTLLDMGAVPGAIYVLNPDFWKNLTDNEKNLMLSAMARGLADQQIGYANRTIEALEQAKNEIDLLEPSDDLKAELEKFSAEYINDLAEKSVKERKIDDPSAMIAQYIELEKKWSELLKDIDRENPEAVQELIMQEIYSKLDINTLEIKQ